MQKKLLTSILAITACSLPFIGSSYFLGLKSRDNTIDNIQWTENTIGQELPIVSFIFDPRNQSAINTVTQLPDTLGLQRIYHITVSPSGTAQDVANGKSDEMYTSFFTLIKKLHIKVVFRTMHEMNGWRYPRWSDPTGFGKARQHVWQLSRDAWLTKEDILFDMSVNGRDIPTTQYPPRQSSPLMFCYPSQKEKLKCPTFEDYYPWDDYVDVMWFTFYNRWKGNGNRLRQNPYDIISHPQWKTLERLKKIKKPLFLDEVWTTSVRYSEWYNQKKSQQVYAHDAVRKNSWLDKLSEFLTNEPEIVGAIYFNIDLTHWLQTRIQWEEDRSIIDPGTHKIYDWWIRLIKNASDNTSVTNPLLDLFGIRHYTRWTRDIFISKLYGKQAIDLLKHVNIYATTPHIEAQRLLDAYANALYTNPKNSVAQKSKSKNIIDEAYRIIVQ